MKRRQNRLRDYDYSKPGAYFVTICVKERKCLLSKVVGGDAYIAPYTELTDIGKVAEKYLRTLPGIGHYVIMPNHVHMMLHISAADPRKGPMWASAPTEANISSLIRSWKILVTKELGVSIWQRSFFDHVIRDEQDYFTKLRYIDENPARWQKDVYFAD